MLVSQSGRAPTDSRLRTAVAASWSLSPRLWLLPTAKGQAG